MDKEIVKYRIFYHLTRFHSNELLVVFFSNPSPLKEKINHIKFPIFIEQHMYWSLATLHLFLSGVQSHCISLVTEKGSQSIGCCFIVGILELQSVLDFCFSICVLEIESAEMLILMLYLAVNLNMNP